MAFAFSFKTSSLVFFQNLKQKKKHLFLFWLSPLFCSLVLLNFAQLVPLVQNHSVYLLLTKAQLASFNCFI